MKEKIILVGVLATSLVFATEIANETNLETKSNLAFDKFDMQVFGINQNLTMTDTNIRVLNDKEMQDTKGAALPLWAWVAIVGGVSNGIEYTYYALQGEYDWNFTDFVADIISSAAIYGAAGKLGGLAGGGVGMAAWEFDAFLLDFGTDLIWRSNPGDIVK